MTLKRQFHLLLAAVAAVPLLCTSVGPLYHWAQSPERVALEKYYRLREHSTEPFSERDWRRLERHLSRQPPDIETCVILGEESGKAKVLISTMKGITEGDIEAKILIQTVVSTSGKYFYQLSALKVTGRENDREKGINEKINSGDIEEEADSEHLFVLTRALRSGKRHKGVPWLRWYVPMCIFVAVILYLVLRLSRTIFSSISVLENKTRLIADGDLNVVLVDTEEGKREGEKEKNNRQSNEITLLTLNLEKMRLSLIGLMEKRTRFIMGISHDLRTPIAVIKGYAEAINDGVVSGAEEEKNAAEIITSKAEQLENMIEELICFVKLDNRSWRLTLKSVLLKDVLEEFSKEAMNAGTVFRRNVKSLIEVGSNTSVPMDKGMFTRMMENLFRNAIRYSNDGDTIEINAFEVDGKAGGGEKERECRIDVCDTGIGMAEGEVGSIFDMFQRGTHSRREEGLGIGLAVVKGVIEAHGWDITVRSKLGEGSVFSIHIPLAAPAPR